MKKTLPYLIIITIIYLAIAFILNEINFTKWEEKIISVSDDELVLENETKITYYYKKFIPYDKRK